MPQLFEDVIFLRELRAFYTNLDFTFSKRISWPLAKLLKAPCNLDHQFDPGERMK